jgi:hypothetical protein
MRVHFSTDDVPPRDREQFWLDFVAKHVMTMTPSERSDDPAAFWAELDVQAVERFALYHYQSSYRSGGRTAADVRRDNSYEFNLRRVPRENIYIAAPTRATAAEVQLSPDDPSVSAPASGHAKER